MRVQAPAGAAPPPAPVLGLLRPTDFAPGTLCSGWAWNCTAVSVVGRRGQVCNSSWSMQGASADGVTRGNSTQPNAIEQLKAFPAPRLDPTAVKTFGRNIAWVSPLPFPFSTNAAVANL